MDALLETDSPWRNKDGCIAGLDGCWSTKTGLFIG